MVEKYRGIKRFLMFENEILQICQLSKRSTQSKEPNNTRTNTQEKKRHFKAK